MPEVLIPTARRAMRARRERLRAEEANGRLPREMRAVLAHWRSEVTLLRDMLCVGTVPLMGVPTYNTNLSAHKTSRCSSRPADVFPPASNFLRQRLNDCASPSVQNMPISLTFIFLLLPLALAVNTLIERGVASAKRANVVIDSVSI